MRRDKWFPQFTLAYADADYYVANNVVIDDVETVILSTKSKGCIIDVKS